MVQSALAVDRAVAGDLRLPGRVLLVACYELGRQPLSLAWPLAYLRRDGFQPTAIDCSLDPVPDAALRRARLIAVATPMHTALRVATTLLERARQINPAAVRCAFGLYAGLNAAHLRASGLVDVVLSGEIEEDLLALVRRLHGDGFAAGAMALRNDRSTTHPPAATLRRLNLPVPDRVGLPPPERYARLRWRGDEVLAGATESTRGCRHTCRHCPLTPVYAGRFFGVPVATVLADVRQQVELGVRHISFGDPDFLNGPTHALRVARSVQQAFPGLTFDATVKVEHLLRHRAVVAELGRLGCIFMVSAVESLSDRVLTALDKGHTRADVMAALCVLDEAGIALRPSLLAFTPWTSADDYLDLLDWTIAEGLEEHIDPVHFAIRLLVPPGSALLAASDAATWLGPLDPADFSFQWRHPDPRMDDLHTAVHALVAEGVRTGASAAHTLAAIRAIAQPLAHGGTRPWPTTAPRRRPTPPRMTESWFC